jgi:hypothetical protein
MMGRSRACYSQKRRVEETWSKNGFKSDFELVYYWGGTIQLVEANRVAVRRYLRSASFLPLDSSPDLQLNCVLFLSTGFILEMESL